MPFRRVGTITLGICLVLTGALLAAALLFKLSIIHLLRFAPLMIVVLGVEILIYAFRANSEKLRYDGLAVFICFMIASFAYLACLAYPLVSQYDDDLRGGREYKLQVKTAVDNALAGGGGILKTDVSIKKEFSLPGGASSQLAQEPDTTIKVSFAAADKELFAVMAREAISKLAGSDSLPEKTIVMTCQDPAGAGTFMLKGEVKYLTALRDSELAGSIELS